MIRPVHYKFAQRFNVPAAKAFEWCTDYNSGDMELMREGNATRSVQRISRDVIVLVDTFFNGDKRTTKKKLVCLHPERLMWISTHLTGPNKYSQFLYEIVPKTRNESSLTLTALHIDYSLKEGIEERKTKLLTKKLWKTDLDNWTLLAKEMERELKE